MAEPKSPINPSDNICNARLSQEDIQKPLSPVLGTGQSLKKLLKTRKERYKRGSKKVVQKLEHIMKPNRNVNVKMENNMLESTDFEALGDIVSNVESIPGPSNSRLSLEHNMPDSALERIQILEELQNRKTNIIKALSISRSVDTSKLKACSNKSKEQPKPVQIGNIQRESSYQNHSKEKTINIVQKQVNMKVNFQTGTGKCINISDTDIKKSTKLFDDIFFPNNNPRNKKFNYLSKLESPGKCSKIVQDEIQSTEKYESTKVIINTPEMKSTTKAVKNIFEGENFNDLKLLQDSGFKAASVALKSRQNNTTFETEHQGKLLQNNTKHENLNDLKLLQNSGYKAFSIKLEDNEMDRKLSEKTSLQKLNINIFEGENFDDLRVSYNSGFQPASVQLKDGKSLIKSEENIANSFSNNIKKPIKNIFEDENFSDLNLMENIGFKSASESLKTELSSTDTTKKTINATFENILGLNGSNKAISLNSNIPQPIIKRPFKNIFEGENFDDINLKFKHNIPGIFKTASSSVKKVNVPKGFKNIFEGENFDDLNLGALGPKFQSPLTGLKRNILQNRTFESPYKTPAKNVDEQTTKSPPFYGFTNEDKEIALNISESNNDMVNIIENRFKVIVSQKNYNSPLVILNSIENLSKKLCSNKHKINLECDLTSGNSNLHKKRKFSELDSDHNSLCQKSLTEKKVPEKNYGTPLQESFLKRPPKKRLGCHFSPTIQISETVLKKAKLMFEDLEYKPAETSTPNKFDRSLATPLICDLTPVQGVKKNLGNSFLNAGKNIPLDVTLQINKAKFGLNKPSEGDVKVWIEKLNIERNVLEEKLKIIHERQMILDNQRTMLEISAKAKKKIVPGVLYNAKSQKGRISLKDLSDYTPSGENASNNFLQQVNPQNAHLVHFYMENKRQSYIQTLDSAVIVPSTEGRIGLTEIEHSFKVMETVDPSLVPKGWIPNHYKWIIWKLASYERRFSNRFENCLCIENVVQQLKYRYDIEIDQAKRSALHKIFERDDCSQRRLILCVSQILKVNNTYELELTDGWYPIKTVLDPPLCDQITQGKIKLGVKLIIYGSELMNCEGCHPLEATDLIYLKINYNSTRRAAWWTKLGCQKNSGPFVVPLSSINMEGGKIGCIKCFITRVYPVKYMEKCGDKNIWRNKKAEDRRQQEFHNEKIKAFEKNNSFYAKLSVDNMQTKESNKNILECIQNVDDAETLYDILQKSNDPEYLQNNLSSSQRTLLYNATIRKSARDQSKFVYNLVDKAKITPERSVSSLLKIKIICAYKDSNDIYDFHVWMPQESHMQELKEGELVTIFNVSCSQKWGLNANRTTQFKRERKPKDERFQKFRRKVTTIEELGSFSKEKHIFNEFDTVGIVIKKRVGDHQQIWLTDEKQNLLAIKIYDSPKNILVLDAVNEEQIVTVCNLTFKHFFEEYSFAVADHFVVFSRYSQFRHLQEAAENLEKELVNMDLASLLQNCRDKVDAIETKSDYTSSKMALDIDDMDCSQITTTDLALLECVDKLT